MYPPDKRSWASILLVIGIVMLLFLLLSARSVEAKSVHVDVMSLDSEINAASLNLLNRAINTAEQDGASALVIEVNSPGGDINSMNSMVQKELASTVPIISYVSPSGAHAASAASFVTLAAPIAAMAPTTRIGAASPVTASGSNIDSTLKAKIENDLVSSISSIQQRYGRNVPLAEAMVTQAKAYDDTTAVKSKLVDLQAPNLSALLNAVDGRTVVLNSGHSVTLQTAGASTQTIETNALDTFYGFLLDPNVIFLLFIVAMIGLYLEISHPGVILPGVVGAIALLLFLLAIGSIAINWAGLAFMVLAFVLLILDVRLPTHGVLTVGAVISLIVGGLLLFNNGGPYTGEQINPLVVYAMAAFVGLIGLTLVTFIVRAQRAVVTTGVEGMIGTRVTALTPLLPEGRVSYGGENWAALLDPVTASADAGSVLEVIAVEGLRLRVRPVRADAAPPE
jgi:membrane-bound serine protease (ClpP class)